MKPQYRTSRHVYRAAVEHVTHFGDSPAPDETWREHFGDEPLPLAQLRALDEIIAEVGVIVDLSDGLDAVEQLRAEGRATLYFPELDDPGLRVTICPGDLPALRRALDAIQREWDRLGVYVEAPLSTNACAPGLAGDRPPRNCPVPAHVHDPHPWENTIEGRPGVVERWYCPGVHAEDMPA
jgi:hypothetical protein